jgi:hypothetical protein
MSATVAATPGIGRRIPSSRSGYSLQCALNDVPTAGPVGAILWGLGIAEVKTARRLGAKGIASMQVRIDRAIFDDSDRRNAVYSTDGVANCRVAMDQFSAQRGVTSFILMGNCACATFCLNTAIADPRVVGLILTNPHVTKRQLLRASLWRKLSDPGTWRRFAAGETDLRENFIAAKALIGRRIRERLAGERHSAAGKPLSDLELPDNLGEELTKLCARGVQVLIACATEDDSLHYLRTTYGAVLGELQSQGKLKLEEVAASAHVFSTDDQASSLLNDAISRWVEMASFTCG